MHEALGWIPSTEKVKRRKGGGREGGREEGRKEGRKQ
jgi:hypothetical protein